jgi:copper(I)-binding protein
LPAAQSISLDGTGQRLVLQNLRQAIMPGTAVKLVFTFQTAGSGDLTAPVAPPAVPLPRVAESDVLSPPE